MQRGRYLYLAALAGALTLAGAAPFTHAATAPATPPATTPTPPAATPATPPAATPAPALPAGFKDVALSAPGSTGSGSTKVTGTGLDAKFEITTTGEDLGGARDRGYFVYQELPGNGSVSARVLTLTGGSKGGWAKQGVMIRESTDSGALMASLNYTSVGNNHPTAQLEPLLRVKVNTGQLGGFPNPNRDLKDGPVFLAVNRQGQTYQTLRSENGKDWEVVAQTTIPIDAGKTVLAGLSSSSQSKTVSSTATVDQVRVSSDIVQPNIFAGPTRLQAFPGTGRVLLTFSAVPNAAGYNIYRREASQSADKAVKVNAQPITNGWFIDTGVGPQGLPNNTPLVYSVKTVTKSLADPKQFLEGAASSEVLVTPQVPQAGGGMVFYWGAPQPAQIDTANNVLTIKAMGSDIWDVADSGVFIAMPVAGDYSVTTKVLEKPVAVAPNKSNNVKAGPMIREGVGPSDRYAFIFATSGRGILVEGRLDFRQGGPGTANNFDGGAPKGDLTNAALKFPIWLRLTKEGAVVTASTSGDGTTYTNLAKPIDLGFVQPVTYAGIAMSSGSSTGFGQAKFDATGGAVKIAPLAAATPPATTPPATTPPAGGTTTPPATGGTTTPPATGGTTTPPAAGGGTPPR